MNTCLFPGCLDLVLAPGVAFTASGHRLGHGMAFYDKFLCDHEKHFGKMPHRLALALSQQVLDCVPVGDTDVKMDEIVYASSCDSNAM